ADTLHRCIKKKILMVQGSFRQEEVLTDWEKGLKDGAPGRVIRFSCVTGPGAYLRSLAAELGQRLGTEALLFSLYRSRVGRWTTADCIHLPGAGGLEAGRTEG
ncbi:MAG TPA: hypothetical protein PLA94_22435, partial [Myxococcota bacterium]|nr:hypothetical protein [Myxococcota bacterium]